MSIMEIRLIAMLNIRGRKSGSVISNINLFCATEKTARGRVYIRYSSECVVANTNYFIEKYGTEQELLLRYW